MLSLESFLSGILKTNIRIIPIGNVDVDFDVNMMPSFWDSILRSRTSISSMVFSIWAPISKKSKTLVSYITDNTVNLSLVKDEPKNSSIGLLYEIETPIYRRKISWLGMNPIRDTHIFLGTSKLGFDLPSSIISFSQIHNGFLSEGVGEFGIRPVDSLFRLSSRIDNTDDSYDYNPDELIGFCGDGAGNEKCYSLNHPYDINDYLTLDWDHESRKIGAIQTFWECIEEFICED